MRIYYYYCFNILGLATHGFAQNSAFELLPTCAQNVVLANADLVTGCASTTDYACYCKNVGYTTAVRLGIINTCSPSDRAIAATQLQDLCEQYGVTFTPTASTLSTTPTPSAQIQTSTATSSSIVVTTLVQTEISTFSPSGSSAARTELVTTTRTSSFTSITTSIGVSTPKAATVLGSSPSTGSTQSSSSSSSSSNTTSKSTDGLAASTKIAIGCAVGIGLPVIVALSIYIFCLKKKNRRQGDGTHGRISHEFVQDKDKEKFLRQETVVHQIPVELDASRPNIIAELR